MPQPQSPRATKAISSEVVLKKMRVMSAPDNIATFFFTPVVFRGCMVHGIIGAFLVMCVCVRVCVRVFACVGGFQLYVITNLQEHVCECVDRILPRSPSMLHTRRRHFLSSSTDHGDSLSSSCFPHEYRHAYVNTQKISGVELYGSVCDVRASAARDVSAFFALYVCTHQVNVDLLRVVIA